MAEVLNVPLVKSMISVQATHTGFVRRNNEDSLLCDDTLGLYLLADGMGGHNAGEAASALAMTSTGEFLRSRIAEVSDSALCELMKQAMTVAHDRIYAAAQTIPLFMGMGTTLVIVLVRNSTAYIVHAGDSRVYLFPYSSEGRGGIKQMTTDHTIGDQLMARGVARARIPERLFHTLTQAVGYDAQQPAPDCRVVECSRDDLLLLCSDGLTDMLTDAEIETILSSGAANLQALANSLVDAANAAGGRDNVSVVLVRIS